MKSTHKRKTSKKAVNILTNSYLDECIVRYTNSKETADYITNYALRAYNQTKKFGLEIYMIEETPPVQDMGKLLNLFDKASITEFNLCDKSTGLMDSLCFLLNNGWSVFGTYEKKIDDSTILQGLHIKKNMK
jgi:hypothetical protein